ncbi:selenium-dependent molybdenum cofactor biosynthesis protein YqeB [Enterococcus sp. CSURQ0835]|uniref:selenium-dependent molybdenum cofactor biosynthesis protein YqeB n=1 Tax=Enterococcus sp. CSURQ0835 TaxID=2681394 RepID=UPI001359A7BE|nr:selenium-dependent molybdenum cofactor biosynthesis protein YqeB [Enterococcus sp. CSURQ0835]
MAALNELIVAVRGGGDLATGVIQKFFHAGFKVVILETAQPLAIRRTVALCNAVYTQTFQVEDLVAEKVADWTQCEQSWQHGQIPLLIDPEAESLAQLRPAVVVDAILAKKNLGTTPEMAPVTIALGPGFSAPSDCQVVIETMRGHSLGKLITAGSALPNTGIPGVLGGKSAERVIHSPASGVVKHRYPIGTEVTKGEILFYVGQTPVYSPLTGVLRGLIQAGIDIPQGLKCGDVDPRPKAQVDCYAISDKARALGGAALEAALMQLQRVASDVLI